MRVLITGANGFLGKNLQLQLAERTDLEVVRYTRSNHLEQLPVLLQEVDFVFHLAGVNRPRDPADFSYSNIDLTVTLCGALADIVVRSGRKVPVLFSSSIQAALNNPYGVSKRAAEEHLFALQREHGVPVYLFRLPNVFGKWCQPDYNSVVATFCHNVSRDLPISIEDPAVALTLVYVDDVVQHFIQLMDSSDAPLASRSFLVIAPQYTTTVGEVARLIKAFKESRNTLLTERVGTGLIRALYATYISYLPIDRFVYDLPNHSDCRGVFVEMLKTPDCGQFSFFTAPPGITRGGHYHHSKTEKFLVIRGKARFRFRNMVTGELHELRTSGEHSEIVETAPGWAHDITNVGDDELICMLWANEIFNWEKPDTHDYPVGSKDRV